MSSFKAVAQNFIDTVQLDAGMLLTSFDADNPQLDTSSIICATTGGISASCIPSYSDLGSDIKNCVHGTKELKHLDKWECKISFTAVTFTPEVIKAALGAADISEDTCMIIPRSNLSDDDFSDIWWVGDRADGGFVAIQLLNALSTSGVILQTQKKGKGQLQVELTGHFTAKSPDTVPMLFYLYEAATEPEEPEYAYLILTGSFGIASESSAKTALAKGIKTEGEIAFTSVSGLLAKLIAEIRASGEISAGNALAYAELLPAAVLNFGGTEEYGTLSDNLSVAQPVHGGADAVDVMKSADDLSAAYAAHGNAKANEEAQVSDNISAAQVLDCPAVSMDENVMSAPDISSAITTPASADGVVKKIAAMSDTGLTAARPGKIASSGTTDLSAESAGKTAGLVFASGKISAGVHTSAAMKAETSEAESSLWAESYGSVLHIYRVYRADQDGTVLYIDKDDDAEDAWAVSDGSTLVITQAYAAAQDGTQLGIE